MRRTKSSTLRPGPHCTKSAAPRSTRKRRLSSNSTGALTCSTRERRTEAASVSGRAPTLSITGTRGSRKEAFSTSAVNGGTIGSRRAVWNGAETGSSTIDAPASLHSADASATAARSPEITVLPDGVGAMAGRDAAQPADLRAVQPQHGGHRADAVGHGFLHEEAALADQVQRFLEGQRIRHHQ